MTLVRMKEDGQIGLPADVLNQIHARNGDLFEVVVADGNIVLKPREAPRAEGPGCGVDISSWIGSGKGAFRTRQEADAFLQSERAQWE